MKKDRMGYCDLLFQEKDMFWFYNIIYPPRRAVDGMEPNEERGLT